MALKASATRLMAERKKRASAVNSPSGPPLVELASHMLQRVSAPLQESIWNLNSLPIAALCSSLPPRVNAVRTYIASERPR